MVNTGTLRKKKKHGSIEILMPGDNKPPGYYDWKDLNVKKHMNENYVLGRIPNELSNEIISITSILTFNGGYGFFVRNNPLFDNTYYDFSWEDDKYRNEIIVALCEETHEFEDIIFRRYLKNRQFNIKVYEVKKTEGGTYLEVLKAARVFV